jgi:hypothetical protein
MSEHKNTTVVVYGQDGAEICRYKSATAVPVVYSGALALEVYPAGQAKDPSVDGARWNHQIGYHVPGSFARYSVAPEDPESDPTDDDVAEYTEELLERLYGDGGQLKQASTAERDLIKRVAREALKDGADPW